MHLTFFLEGVLGNLSVTFSWGVIVLAIVECLLKGVQKNAVSVVCDPPPTERKVIFSQN